MKKLSETYKEQGIAFTFPIEIKDGNGNVTYYETSDGDSRRGLSADENGDETYYEDSNGFWCRSEYDENGNETCLEDSDGYWSRREYDDNRNLTYFENSNGFWCRYEYDEDARETYYENSCGAKRGIKKGSCTGKVIEVDGKKYKLTEL